MSSRPLRDMDHVNNFLSETLHIDTLYSKRQYNRLVMDITGMEAQVSSVVENDTSSGKHNRLSDYATEKDRVALRKRILNELSNRPRLENDDLTSLGKGGALPRCSVQYGKTAFFIIGLPASGKSGVANILADHFGAIMLDSDLAKRKFPEYKASFGASLVHEESSVVVFGQGNPKYANEPSLMQFAIKSGANIIIPKIGSTIESIESLARVLHEDKGYAVHLVLVRLNREKATIRAIQRYAKTKRYVPIALIYDGYGNEPTITFYDMMSIGNTAQLFESFTMVSSDVKPGEKKPIMFATEKSPLMEIDL